ncbi:MAG: mechanosensitive ion channel family protein, partial [Bacteroidota bacterium]
VGDIITANGFTGKVKEIQIFNTVLLLEDNKTAILPNGSVSNGAIINHTKQPFLVCELSFTLPMMIDQTAALEELTSLLQQDDRVMDNPGVKFSIRQLAGDKVHYIACMHCKPTQLDDVMEDARAKLLRFYKTKDYSI